MIQATSVDTAGADLIRLSEDSNAALMRGDIDRYLSLLSLSQDFSLMSPFGGEPLMAETSRTRPCARWAGSSGTAPSR